jgi:putative SOS response-associated peptidase YedK
MCGRATLTVSIDDIREVFGPGDVPELPARFNLAPSQPLLVMRAPERFELLTWGPKFINAKIEHATTRPTNRCLVILDGFYEWRHGDRQPFYFHRADAKPFAVGGVTRTKEAACAIVTCPADERMIDLHSRMPLILSPGDWAGWLAGDRPEATLAGFDRYPVSRLVNSPKNDDSRCVEPAADPQGVRA